MELILNCLYITLSCRSINKSYLFRPGGKLKPGESEVQGLKRKLNSKLRRKGDEIDWEIGDLMAQWWRPNYETLMVCFNFVHYDEIFFIQHYHSILTYRHI